MLHHLPQNRLNYEIVEYVAPVVLEFPVTADSLKERQGLSLAARADDTFSAVEAEIVESTNWTHLTLA